MVRRQRAFLRQRRPRDHDVGHGRGASEDGTASFLVSRSEDNLVVQLCELADSYVTDMHWFPLDGQRKGNASDFMALSEPGLTCTLYLGDAQAVDDEAGPWATALLG